jgi:CRISPR-associated protein Cas6
MFWQDEPTEATYQVPDDVMDLAFSISCEAIPVDHALALALAIEEILPWFSTEPEAGLHLIHGGASINGWQRPETADELLLLPKRAKLRLRLPKHRIDDAALLYGKTLEVAGHMIKVGGYKSQLLGKTDTLLSRYIVSDATEGDEAFTERMLSELRAMGLEFTKIISGQDHTLVGPDGQLTVKSLLVSGLNIRSSIKLQIKGIGPHRNMGFGLFIASKSI